MAEKLVDKLIFNFLANYWRTTIMKLKQFFNILTLLVFKNTIQTNTYLLKQVM